MVTNIFDPRSTNIAHHIAFTELMTTPELHRQGRSSFETTRWKIIMKAIHELESTGSPVFCAGYLVSARIPVESPCACPASQNVKRILTDVKAFCIPTHLKAKSLEELVPSPEFHAAPLKLTLKPKEINLLQQRVRSIFWNRLPHTTPFLPPMPQKIPWSTFRVTLVMQFPPDVNAPQYWWHIHMMTTGCCKHIIANETHVKFVRTSDISQDFEEEGLP